MRPDFIITQRPDGWHARRPADGWSTGPFPTYRAMKAVVDDELVRAGVWPITSIIHPRLALAGARH